MRKIIFRGKRKDGSGWVYGDLNQNDIHHGVAIRQYGVINNAVLPETVGQFTGLTDKHGKEIYEGDVVKLTEVMPFCAFGDEFIGQVVFCECAYCVDNGAEAYSIFSETGEIEIIGNIHDTPELLTKKEEET